MGDADFLYMLGDALASQVQYGGKAAVCRWLRKLPLSATDNELVAHWANFTLTQCVTCVAAPRFCVRVL